MLNRRSFIESMGGLGMMMAGGPIWAAAASEKRRIFILETYFMKQGTQPERARDHLTKTVLPFMAKNHAGPRIVLEPVVVPHMPQLTVVVGFGSLAEMWDLRLKAMSDKELMAGFDAWENHSEPAFEHCSISLLEATDYSPELKNDAAPAKASRIFELRVYHSPTWRQLKALHERFAGPEIRIFHRVGIHPILYSSTLIGQNIPNLVYLTPFENLDAREKAWAAFGADPEWQKVRKESIDRAGQISSQSNVSLYRAAAYSPIR